jgi:hypothetical protein
MTLRLVAVPAAISLAVTLLRLAGERAGLSEAWFSTATQGIVPSGMTWLIGITWLAAPFGAWFAWRLAREGQGPASVGRAIGVSLAGAAIAVLGLLVWRPPFSFPGFLFYVWSVMAAAAAVQFLAWPALARTAAAYGLLARIPVVVVMFLAMRGGWGTHYDYKGVEFAQGMSLGSRFLYLALVPQLVFWVAFTVVVGVLAGSLTLLALPRASPARLAE